MQVADTCPHYPRGVPAQHVCDAKIVVVGEAPGEQEAETGLPFVGRAGFLLDKLLQESGLSRRELYVTNVLDHRPTAFSNDIRMVSFQELEKARFELMKRLRLRTRPNLVVPLGNTALSAVVGVPGGIQKWRGSILKVPVWGVKAIATLHPAFLLRVPDLAKTCLRDWRRIAHEARFPEVHEPQRLHHIHPSRSDLTNLVHLMSENSGQALAVDIETNRRDQAILCVGFAKSSEESWTIPWRDPAIKALCELPNPKILTNGMFDYWHLHRQGIELRNFFWDISLMFHCLDPSAGPTVKGKSDSDLGERSRIKAYSLAYMASIWDIEPYWKDEAKEESQGDLLEHWDRDTFLTYNGKDCTSTYAIWEKLYDALVAAGLLGTYFDLYGRLIAPLTNLMLRGVRVDVGEAEKRSREFQESLHRLHQEITSLVGYPLHAVQVGAQWFRCEGCKRRHKTATCPKGHETVPIPAKTREGTSISQAKLKAYLYGPKGLRLPRRTVKGKVTTNAAALRELLLRRGDLPVVGKVLEFRRTEKLASFLNSGIVDADGRIRSQYKMLVQTGRLSSTTNPSGTGTNLQNTDAELMYLLKPDEGKVWLRADLSQAEDRIVKVLTGVPRLVDEARSLPDQYDTHRAFAAQLFSTLLGRTVAPEEVTAEQRYLAKRGRHASNYGMGPKKLAEILLKDGPKVGISRVVPVRECEGILAAILAVTPEIETRYHRPIRDMVMHGKELVNSWGHRIDFGTVYRYSWNEQREAVFRKAYAWLPQSEVGRLMNQWGLLVFEKWVKENRIDAAINLQRHDELVISVFREEAYDVARCLHDSLTRPRHYCLQRASVDLSMPVEFAVALNGDKHGAVEFKALPSRDTFDAKVKEGLKL